MIAAGLLIPAAAGILISAASWIFAGYFWKFIDFIKREIQTGGKNDRNTIGKRP